MEERNLVNINWRSSGVAGVQELQNKDKLDCQGIAQVSKASPLYLFTPLDPRVRRFTYP
jgi:hypothetical protein